MRFWVHTPARAEIGCDISVPPVATSQLSYDEYTDRTLSVGRGDGEGETGHPPPYVVAKKMKSLKLHTLGCCRASLRDCFFFLSCSLCLLPFNCYFYTSTFILLSCTFTIILLHFYPITLIVYLLPLS